MTLDKFRTGTVWVGVWVFPDPSTASYELIELRNRADGSTVSHPLPSVVRYANGLVAVCLYCGEEYELAREPDGATCCSPTCERAYSIAARTRCCLCDDRPRHAGDDGDDMCRKHWRE